MPGSAENDGIILTGIFYDISAGQEAAHAVAKEDIWQVGVLCAHDLPKPVHILHNAVPAVLRGEKAQVREVFGGLAVAQMVIPGNNKAVFRKKGHKIVIALNIFRNAMGNLNHCPGSPVRQAFAGVHPVHSRAGTEVEILKNGHGNILLFVL